MLCAVRRALRQPLRSPWRSRRLSSRAAPAPSSTATSAGAIAAGATALERIRNFSITGHVDHGKSTLCDRLLQLTHALSPKLAGRQQITDTLQVERRRGITVKLQTVRLTYEGYVLNFLDTPGHVDFSYEVSRSLAACEGALLLVDATQGVQAQTVANAKLALESNLALIPVLNKIDLPNADLDGTAREVEHLLGVDCSAAIPISAKTGEGVPDVLRAIVESIPPPVPALGGCGDPDALRALIFDSVHDRYRGVVVLARLFSGSVRVGDRIRVHSTQREYLVDEVGYLAPGATRVRAGALHCGEVGYVLASIKQLTDAPVGATLVPAAATTAGATAAAPRPLPGYRPIKPTVFCGVYPEKSGTDYETLRAALARLHLTDAALRIEPESSAVLGQGFRVGFLGMLHMDIVLERLQNEHGVRPFSTAPAVAYRLLDGALVDNPMKLPAGVTRVEEPWCRIEAVMPAECIGSVMELLQSRRGELVDQRFVGGGGGGDGDTGRVHLEYDVPFADLIGEDLFGAVRARTRGFAALDYRLLDEYRCVEVARLDFAVAGERVDGLSLIAPRGDEAHRRGKLVVERLKRVIPRQQFKVSIQCVVGARVIAAEHLSAVRKDVTAKLYGGDVTRKKKLLERQKQGKKQMRQVGRVQLPQEAFTRALRFRDV